MDEIELREATAADHAFIFATWLRSYRHSSSFAKKLSNEIYFDRHHKVIDLILKRKTLVFIAHPKDEENQILGYLVLENQENLDGKDVIHYCYVKKTFRKIGVASLFAKVLELDKKSYVFTHWTSDTDWIAKKFNLTYDPYRI